MCGVVGYQSDAPSSAHSATVRALCAEVSVRGLHAFGIATSPERVFRYYALSGLDGFLRRSGPVPALIAHARYSTSGDWLNRFNNQPLAFDGMALAFNGVIDMRTRAEYQADWPFAFESENDGEIFVRWVLSGRDPAEFVRRPCSFAGVYLLKGEVWALRNEFRPLWYACPDGATTMVASTRDAFLRAGVCDAREIPAYEVFSLRDLRRARPVTAHSQQATRLFAVPPRYAGHGRYGPRLSGDALPGGQV